MTCDGCVKDISGSLNKVEGMVSMGYMLCVCICVANACVGVRKVDADLKNQLVFVEGVASPSSIVSAIQDTGRDAILRGSGTSNSTLFCPFVLFVVSVPCEAHAEMDCFCLLYIYRFRGLHLGNAFEQRLE